jgi:hypothetical protein
MNKQEDHNMCQRHLNSMQEETEPHSADIVNHSCSNNIIAFNINVFKLQANMQESKGKFFVNFFFQNYHHSSISYRLSWITKATCKVTELDVLALRWKRLNQNASYLKENLHHDMIVGFTSTHHLPTKYKIVKQILQINSISQGSCIPPPHTKKKGWGGGVKSFNLVVSDWN